MISLIIRSKDCRGLEMAMQGFLRVRGRQVFGGGDEWYLTSRDELIDIYNSVMGFKTDVNQEAELQVLPPMM